MKNLFLFAILIGSVFSQFSADQCTYYASESESGNSESESFYQLSSSKWQNITDGQGNSWFYNPCPQQQWTFPCGSSDATLCKVTPNGEIFIRGYFNTSQWATDNNGNLEAMYVSNQVCTTDPKKGAHIVGPYKTVVQFSCDVPHASIYEEPEQCGLVTIKIGSQQGCLVNVTSTSFVSIHHSRARFVVILLSCIAISVSLCCCLGCACARRRSCRQKICKQQFSNVAFQPVPVSTQATRTATPNVPAYNPFIPAPQYFYYYPTQQQQTQAQVPLQNVVVENSDEKLARQLQAQYDREAAQL